MAQLIEILRVEVGLENLVARVRVSEDAPLMTSEDLEGTTRVYRLLPHIIDHVCLGDVDKTFKGCMGNTELAHLLEHMTVELLAQTNRAGDITSGRTRPQAGESRTFDIEIACVDDVLTIGALSSAVWILDWAFTGGGEPEPDVEAIVSGLNGLLDSLGSEPASRYEEGVRQSMEEHVRREYDEALEERERAIAAREREIEEARAEARERARAAAEERARAEEEARLWAEAEAAAAERARAEEEAAAAEQGAARTIPSPEAVQASRDLPDEALVAWREAARIQEGGPDGANDVPGRESSPEVPTVPEQDGAASGNVF